MTEGRLKVVTAIMKDRIVPNCAPLYSRASATGMVPKISAYMGTPTRVQFAREQVGSTFRKVFPYILAGVGIGAVIHNWRNRSRRASPCPAERI